jgi:hypothetical protein
MVSDATRFSILRILLKTKVWRVFVSNEPRYRHRGSLFIFRPYFVRQNRISLIDIEIPFYNPLQNRQYAVLFFWDYVFDIELFLLDKGVLTKNLSLCIALSSFWYNTKVRHIWHLVKITFLIPIRLLFGALFSEMWSQIVRLSNVSGYTRLQVFKFSWSSFRFDPY